MRLVLSIKLAEYGSTYFLLSRFMILVDDRIVEKANVRLSANDFITN